MLKDVSCSVGSRLDDSRDLTEGESQMFIDLPPIANSTSGSSSYNGQPKMA